MRFALLSLALLALVSAAPQGDIEARAESTEVRRSRAGESDLSARAPKTIENVLCINTAMCLKYAKKSDIPTDGKIICNTLTRHCQKACNNGFTLTAGKCFASKGTCAGVKCPSAPDFGYFTCTGARKNVCSLACKSGYTVKAKYPFLGKRCINVLNDEDNCGTEGKSCPFSYNGLGARYCYLGGCSLTCPSRYSVAFTKAKRLPYCKK